MRQFDVRQAPAEIEDAFQPVHNAPKYLVIEFSIADQIATATDDEVLASSSKLMDKFDSAFAALAK